MSRMTRFLFWFGSSLSSLAALCCVTPVLPWALSTLGLGGLTQILWRDEVLFPALAGGFVLVAWSLGRREEPDLRDTDRGPEAP